MSTGTPDLGQSELDFLLNPAASPGQLRVECKSPLQDVHCYADACACLLGGDVSKNYMPSGIVPATAGEEIPVYWNKKRITWDSVSKQFLFDGKPGGWTNGGKFTDGYPERGVMGRITDVSQLKCDAMAINNSAGEMSCVPGQRRASISGANGVTWTFIFRRLQPPDSSVSNRTDDRHPNNFTIIDVIAHRLTDKIDPVSGKKQYAVCYFDTLNSGGGKKGFATIPVPGGRWGANETKRGDALQFWDTPTQVKDGNCADCHGLGPIKDSEFYRNGEDNPAYANHDNKNLWFSAANLFPPGKFFKLDATNGCNGSCHSGFWRRNAETCSTDVDNYTTRLSAPFLSKFRQGFFDIEPGAKGPYPIPADPFAAQITAMPKDYDQSALFSEYQSDLVASINELKNCCGGVGPGCQQEYSAGQPTYYGQQSQMPVDPYSQMIPGPKAATSVTLTLGQCNTQRCQVSATWEDPSDKFGAPTKWRLSWDPKPQSVAFGSDPFCTAFPPLSDASDYDPGFPKSKSAPNPSWRRLYKVTRDIDCGKKVRVTLCGEHCDNVATASGNSGILSNEVIANCGASGVQVNVTKSGDGAALGSVTGIGISCGADCSEILTPGSQVVLSASTSSTHTFVRWSGACAAAGTSRTCRFTVPSSGPVNVGAEFSAPRTTLTVAKNGSGTGTVVSPGINCGSDCTEAYAPGTSVTLTALPSINSEFVGWTFSIPTIGTLCMGSSRTCRFTVGSVPLTVTAKFIGYANPSQLLMVLKEGSGKVYTSSRAEINCGLDCSHYFQTDATVTLFAEADQGWQFEGWEFGGGLVADDCNTQTTCMFAMPPMSIELTARFNFVGLP